MSYANLSLKDLTTAASENLNAGNPVDLSDICIIGFEGFFLEENVCGIIECDENNVPVRMTQMKGGTWITYKRCRVVSRVV